MKLDFLSACISLKTERIELVDFTPKFVLLLASGVDFENVTIYFIPHKTMRMFEITRYDRRLLNSTRFSRYHGK